MKPEPQILFLPYRLDTVNGRLWQGGQVIPLRPKTFAVLRYLLEHPGRLMTKEELLKAVWPNIYVSKVVPMVCIRELRKALGDDPRAPQFIETVPRRGYRFIGKITTADHTRTRNPAPETRNPMLVGREAELGQLQSWLEKALGGERQVVFVTGEAGIGKTTVVEAFLERAAANGDLWIAREQCIEQYGAGEAYMPVLEALGQLCREPRGERLIELLGRYAPTWLAQMPWLISEAEHDVLQRKTQGATQKRMLREMAEWVEALTAERLLVLVLEDLQWSDYSTLDLVSLLARRREPARLLLIGTYRLVEVHVNGHPLKAVKQELQIHGQCEELPLQFLTEAAVAEYVATRFPGGELSAGLGSWVYQRTDGNPLFMVNMVDYLVGQGLMVKVDERWELKAGIEGVEVGVPGSLRQMIEKQIDGLSIEEQRVLEVASVAGVEFSAAAVAAGLEKDMVQIEERCEGLARRGQFLRSSGVEEWPDGTVAARYGFMHALYQNVLYERVTAGKRVQLHRRIGEREEQGYGDGVKEIAAELAIHFERGRDCRRAAQYLGQAADNAAQRHAYREAIDHCTRGLELLKALPDTPERTQQELVLQTGLGWALLLTKGLAAPEVETTYTRALELCQQVGETPQLFRVLGGMWNFYVMRSELEKARALAEQCLRLAQSARDPTSLAPAHFIQGITCFCIGELVPARAHLEQAIVLSDPLTHFPNRVCYLSNAAFVLWSLGYPDQALKRTHEALTLAQEMSHPFYLAYALTYAAQIHLFRREWQAAQERAEAAIALSTDQGFVQWMAHATILRGGALASQGQVEEGIAQIRQGLAAWRATGTELLRPNFLALLAGAYGRAGQVEEGLTLVAEALAAARKNGQCLSEAWLYWFKGELLRQKAKGKGQKAKAESEAEECFHQAIDIARQQSAKSLELRAVMSLSRLWQEQGKKEEARKMLAEIYGWFTEGFDTADLKEARTLLQELGG